MSFKTKQNSGDASFNGSPAWMSNVIWMALYHQEKKPSLNPYNKILTHSKNSS